MKIVTENFIKEPTPGDTVKVYLGDVKVAYGIVDSLEHIFYVKRIKRKKVFSNIRFQRQIVILKQGKYKKAEYCDFCLPEEKTRFI